MEQANAFNAALICTGFNADTAQAIIDKGFDTLEVLLEIEEDDIDHMIKNVRETRRIQGAQAQGNVTFPFLAIRRLKAMRCWAAKMHHTGRALNRGLFTGALITTAVLCYSLDLMCNSVADNEVVHKPKELINLAKWETFWEQWRTYAGRLRGRPSALLPTFSANMT
jgi:hypothetical protein